MRHRIALGALAVLAALIFSATAFGHAHISPPTALSGTSYVYTLAVPTEKENATTTSIELTPPEGFSIDSFVPAPGWKRETQTKGSGEEAAVVKVTWAGGSVQTGDAAAFSFLGQAAKPGSYAFSVRQTYSDGSVVDWTGPESSDSPAPTLEAVSSFGGGRSTVEIVAIVLAGIALAVAVVALVARSGRPLA
jgi:uncharacterized protein YcnI